LIDILFVSQVASKQLEGVLDVAAQQRQVHDSETAAMRAQVKEAEEHVKRTEDEVCDVAVSVI
jgi:hypothetical protein